MRTKTIRVSDQIWSLINDEAQRQGLTIAGFIREAIIKELAYQAAKRGDRERDEASRRVEEALRVEAERISGPEG